jgi:glycosyltransferase involved in cell wall biosynthesis
MNKPSATPRFSVVIPCYNEENYIHETLHSLFDQDYVGSFEVIVVDNNCTDATMRKAKQFDVRVVTESRAGVCFARQSGTEAAHGEIVISTDADTQFSSNWLSSIATLFDANHDVVAVAGPCIYKDGPLWIQPILKLVFGFSKIYAKVFGHPNYATATNLAFKKSAWTAYDTYAQQGGDEIGMIRQLKEKGRIVFSTIHPVYTSARRLKKGAFYTIFVAFLYFYVLGYWVNRIMRRQIIGANPSFRYDTSGQQIAEPENVSVAEPTSTTGAKE